MSQPIDVTDVSFNEAVLQSDLPVLVDFWAARCRPCMKLAPVIDDIAASFTGQLKVVKVDVDANPETSQSQAVASLPTIRIYKHGQAVTNIVGARPKFMLMRAVKKQL